MTAVLRTRAAQAVRITLPAGARDVRIEGSRGARIAGAAVEGLSMAPGVEVRITAALPAGC